MKQKSNYKNFDLGDLPEAQEREAEKEPDYVEELRHKVDSLYQIVHDKGLEVGLPRRIRDDIRELIGIINRLDNVWDSKEKQEKKKDFEENIAKLVNKGDVTTAFIKVSDELRNYKEDMVGIRMFLNMITFKLNHLLIELEKK